MGREVIYHIYRYLESDTKDGDANWSLYAKRKTKRGAVKVIRKLQSMGYDRDASIYVELKGSES